MHESRLLSENIKIAFNRLKLIVDTKLNGKNSYENQFKHFEFEYKEKLKRSKQKRREAKLEFDLKNVNNSNNNKKIE